MPPKEVVDNMVHPEAPPTHPCGPNTNFQYPTPMPFRFVDKSLDFHNSIRHNQKAEHPIYQTTSAEIGKMDMQATDFHMRWYGLAGTFTTAHTGGGAVLPKSRVSTGLNTAFDRSVVHPTMDQGWSGHLGLTDFNISNKEYAKHVVRPTRKAPVG